MWVYFVNRVAFALFALFVLSPAKSFAQDATSPTPVNILPAQTVSLNGDDWRIAIDPDNIGRHNDWFTTPPITNSQQTPVPWVIQDIFPNYHGVAWYWRTFTTPNNPHTGGRYLLKFHAVDYLADVWVNGQHVGGYEGSETPFEMDVTDALISPGDNLLVVRVLNPTYEPIDGITLKDTPSGAKNYPVGGNSCYNSGGIVGDVHLLVVPAVRVSELFIAPDWKTGHVRIQTTVINTRSHDISVPVSFQVSEARTGLMAALTCHTHTLKAGMNSVEVKLFIPEHKLWSPDDPVLYRAEGSVQAFASLDVCVARFGFRDFRFHNGYFRLNGKRIFLRGANDHTQYPVSYTVPLCDEMLRRDVIYLKALGYNFVRIPFGCPVPRKLDMYDELGILVMQEHYGSWQMGQYGQYSGAFPRSDNWEDLLIERFERSIRNVIMRDRNHASVVMWGLLNENPDDRLFRTAVALLPALRRLDPSRLIVLNSGRYDRVKEIGSMSNPDSETWDVAYDELYDWHPYRHIPFSPVTLDELSGRSRTSDQALFITEAGLCSPINLPSVLGDYQQRGKEHSDDARYFQRQYELFLTDWTKLTLEDIWPRPEDYLRDAYHTANALRETLETAVRSNPCVISYAPTSAGRADLYGGEGLWTNFRRLKSELVPSVLLANSTLRWCVSTEPQSIYRGESLQVRASFSSLDALPAGEYPASIRVVGPDMKIVFERTVTVTMGESEGGQVPPFAQSILEEDITISGPVGTYQLQATLDRGGTAMGGRTEFYVTDRATLPEMPPEVVVIGTDAMVSKWLKDRNIRIAPFDAENRSVRQVILLAGQAPDAATLRGVAGQMARGSVAIFLSPSTFGSGADTTRWLPLVNKGVITPMDAVAGYYRADRWAKKHPVFEGMPAGGMMDYRYFRNVISLNALSQEYAVVIGGPHAYHQGPGTPLTYPSEAICGATRLSHTYCSGVHLGIWDFGQGQFMVNTLHIAEHLENDPAADRLLCNMLNFASRDVHKPMEDLPDEFDRHLAEIGYLE